MKYFTFLFCLCCIAGYSQNIHIPDVNFEKALIDLKIDSDQTINGQISKIDAQLVTYLDVSSMKIKNLKGIEAFTSLNFLNCKNNSLSHLNLSQNITLITVITDVNDVILNNQNNQLFMWID